MLMYQLAQQHFYQIFFLFTVVSNCYANNLSVSNVSLEDRNPSSDSVVVEFDVSWENSWKTKINHDAIWLTVRLYDPNISPTNKKLCKVTASGQNPTGTSIGSNSELEIYVPSDMNGAFLRPSSYGDDSSVSSTDVQLTVDYSACGFNDNDSVKVSVLGVEMVYVPEGAFYAGDNDTSSAALNAGSGDSDPWYVSDSSAISVTNPAADGYRYVSAGNTDEDATGTSFTISSDYPNGYDAFYAMKYEITEGQWVEFINSLPSASARANKDITDSSHKNTDIVISRNTVSCSGSPLTCSTSRPSRSVGFLSWMDLTAFLDWAALRPMSELEFEKISRGPVLPVAGEFAWGTTSITAAATISSGAEAGSETITDTGANANYNNTVLGGGDTGSGAEYTQGPLRASIFATSASDREGSGAGYYGAMDLSGNLAERVVTVGNVTGRLFAGSNGDGSLSSDSGCEGNANQSDWAGIDGVASCGITGADGSGFKGGSWKDEVSGARLRISDRNAAAQADTSAYENAGGRGVRTYE